MVKTHIHKLRLAVIPLLAVLVSGMVALSGCTVTAGGKSGYSQKQGGYAEVWIQIVFDPTGQDLANFDTSQAWGEFSLTNQAIQNSTGTFTITVTDTNGNTLGAQSFAYYISAGQLYASNPSAIHQWFQQFSNQSNVDVQVSENDLSVSPTTTSDTTASITTKAQYSSTEYASTTASTTVSGGSYVTLSGGCKNCKVK